METELSEENGELGLRVGRRKGGQVKFDRTPRTEGGRGGVDWF